MEAIIDYFTQLPQWQGYGMFLILWILSGMFTPFNSDTTMLIAAFLTGNGHFESHWIIPLSIIGIVTGDSICFIVFKKYGGNLFKIKWVQNNFPPERMNKGRVLFERHGNLAFSLCRLILGIRSLTFVTGAILGAKFRIFFIYNLLMLCLWCTALHFLGKFTGQNWEQILAMVQRFQIGFMILVTVAIVFVIYRKKKMSRSDNNFDTLSDQDS